MLTSAQRKSFDELKKGERKSPQEKADLYYRVSKNIKKTLTHSIKDTVELLDELPEPYLAKIDFYEAAINTLNLIEKLINRLGPTSPMGDRVFRKFRVEVEDPLLNIGIEGKSLAFVTVGYDPTCTEIDFLNRLKKLHDRIEHVTKWESESGMNYTLDEFNKILKKFEKKNNLTVKSGFIGAAKPEGEEPK